MQRSKARICQYRSEQTEMGYSTRMLREVHARFAEHAPEVQPWYQLDRGYDATSVIQLAHELNMRLTVRASYSRRVRTSKTEPVAYLFSLLQNAARLGQCRLQLPTRPGRPARVVVLDVRVRKVSIEIKTSRKRRAFVPVTVVTARELNHPNPLHWRLMTTVAVRSLQDALSVIHGYTSAGGSRSFIVLGNAAFATSRTRNSEAAMAFLSGLLSWLLWHLAHYA
jgi:hypothetical protein